MAVGSGQISVAGTPATLLASAPQASPPNATQYVLLAADANFDVYLGGTGVTTSTGFKFAAATTAPLPLALYPGDALYGVTSGSTATIGVLVT